jgi:hypothetical protein
MTDARRRTVGLEVMTDARSSNRAGFARIIGLDIAGPLITYRLCRSGGLPQVWALVLSGTPPGLGVLFDYVRWRTLEVVGVIVLGGITLSLALALISGSTKAVLLEGAAGNGAFGLVCLVSLWRRRPLLFYFIQAFYGGRHSGEGADLEVAHDSIAEVRAFFRLVTVVWGFAYVVEAAALALVVQAVSTGTALTVNKTAPWVVFALLFAWSYRRGMRLRTQRRAAG